MLLTRVYETLTRDWGKFEYARGIVALTMTSGQDGSSHRDSIIGCLLFDHLYSLHISLYLHTLRLLRPEY
jgi:hypothetical protein